MNLLSLSADFRPRSFAAIGAFAFQERGVLSSCVVRRLQISGNSKAAVICRFVARVKIGVRRSAINGNER